MNQAILTVLPLACAGAAAILIAVRRSLDNVTPPHPWTGLDVLDAYDDELIDLQARPAPGYDSPEARARRVAVLTAEREALEAGADLGRDRREERDARRRRWLDREQARYGLAIRARHVDDMVA